MSELPEMRASDHDRELIAERLRDAVAEGRLTMEEFDERLTRAYEARTQGELSPLVADLPATGTPSAVTAPDGAARWSERVGGKPTSRFALAFCGGFERKGSWTVGRDHVSVAVMGGGEIDLREARFEEREVVIRCFALMGGIDVTVPPELNVQVSGFGLMGGFGEEGEVEGAPDPSAPTVRVTGFALMGGVGVRRKLRKAEKRRLKEERERARLEGGEPGAGGKRLPPGTPDAPRESP
ncbi:DUF1707 domain-containing protein [Streptomyces sp. NPDC057638]|uniref:DUF1707 SHOCT-like domain-containing protein n=1 Tax=Streptomyces sp. NPDC057638 TaxID=3346190 RepID=UPI0036814DB5